MQTQIPLQIPAATDAELYTWLDQNDWTPAGARWSWGGQLWRIFEHRPGEWRAVTVATADTPQAWA